MTAMISQRQLVLVLALSLSCGPPMKTGTGWSRSSVLPLATGG